MKTVMGILLVAAAFVGGYGYGRWYGKPASVAAGGGRKVLYYVDAMHPWYKSDKPGIAPDCNMKLTPVYEGEENKLSGPGGTVQVSAEKQQLIGVQFGTAEYENVSDSI